ncbi:MAG: PIN domain-containing protein [candidate division NC10 bacterium]
MIILDTSGLLSAIDASQRHHAACAEILAEATRPLVLSPFVLAELDYLLATQVGGQAQLALVDEVARGVYRLESFSAHDVAVAGDVMRRYANLAIGLADASIVVLAQRHGTRDVLTLDERHFRAVRAADGRRFRLLPADR